MSAVPTFVNRTWLDEHVPADALDRLVYRSQRLGDDPRITNTGGGNTSSKTQVADPITGEMRRVLYVKGSGGDLRTAGRDGYAALDLDRLDAVRSTYLATPDRGLKSVAEDAMVDLYGDCAFTSGRAPSIDTPLHAFIPHPCVDHTHPNSVIAIAASANGEEITREIYGNEVRWIPWMRPGLELGLAIEKMCNDHPDAIGAVLGGHGLICWAEDDRTCYDRTLELIDRAARYLDERDRGSETFGGERITPMEESARESTLLSILPWLRGQVSRQRRMVGTVQWNDDTLAFIGSHDAPRLADMGTSCPDHFLRTKIKPLFVDWNHEQESTDDLQAKLAAGLDAYQRDYADYYDRCCDDESPAMRPAAPTVVLIPGVGMIAWGASKTESRITAEFYTCAIAVMRGAESIGGYVALPQQEAFDIEYWRLEEAKLQRMPAPRPLAGRVIAVIGAGSGIGRGVPASLAADGATIVCADRDLAAAEASADVVADDPRGIAGSGVSNCGAAIAVETDITDRGSVRDALDQATLAYGGIDGLVVTAGVFPTAKGDEAYDTALTVNTHGAAITLEEAGRIFLAQELPASIVLTTSVNAVVPKAGSTAYDVSKAAANQLVRSMAVTLAPVARVNAVAPATVLDGSSMFPRDRVLASLAKYAIDHDPEAPTEDLVARLGRFYAERTLLDRVITVEDQVNAIRWLSGPESACTTGQVINVDGGLTDAFLR